MVIRFKEIICIHGISYAILYVSLVEYKISLNI